MVKSPTRWEIPRTVPESSHVPGARAVSRACPRPVLDCCVPKPPARPTRLNLSRPDAGDLPATRVRSARPHRQSLATRLRRRGAAPVCSRPPASGHRSQPRNHPAASSPEKGAALSLSKPPRSVPRHYPTTRATLNRSNSHKRNAPFGGNSLRALLTMWRLGYWKGGLQWDLLVGGRCCETASVHAPSWPARGLQTSLSPTACS